MEKRGYKAFNNDLSNRYGKDFEEGGVYTVEGPISFGNYGNGFHFCERLEDTLRYFDAMDDEIKIAEVIGRGEIVEYFDDYYGYYDMFAASELEVVKVLSREEIVGPYLMCSNSERVKRFVSGYRLTPLEKDVLRTAHHNKMDVLQAIDYHQDGILDAYDRKNVKRYFKSIRDQRGDKHE